MDKEQFLKYAEISLKLINSTLTDFALLDSLSTEEKEMISSSIEVIKSQVEIVRGLIKSYAV